MKAVSSVSFAFFVCLPHREVVVLQDRTESLYNQRNHRFAEATQSSGLPSTAGQQLEEEHGGFLTVGKGSRGKGLASARSLERMPSTLLATEALQDLETQASSPDIQDTLERWTQQVECAQACPS